MRGRPFAMCSLATSSTDRRVRPWCATYSRPRRTCTLPGRPTPHRHHNLFGSHLGLHRRSTAAPRACVKGNWLSTCSLQSLRSATGVSLRCLSRLRYALPRPLLAYRHALLRVIRTRSSSAAGPLSGSHAVSRRPGAARRVRDVIHHNDPGRRDRTVLETISGLPALFSKPGVPANSALVTSARTGDTDRP